MAVQIEGDGVRLAALSFLLAVGDREWWAGRPNAVGAHDRPGCCLLPAVQPLFPLLPQGHGTQEGHGTESHLLCEKLDLL